jgi:hypothetical protein
LGVVRRFLGAEGGLIGRGLRGWLVDVLRAATSSTPSPIARALKGCARLYSIISSSSCAALLGGGRLLGVPTERRNGFGCVKPFGPRGAGDTGTGSEPRSPFFINISMDSARVGGSFTLGVLAPVCPRGELEFVVDSLKGLGWVKRRGLGLAGV